MSLMPVIFRDPGEADITSAERVIYDAFIDALDNPTKTSPERAILRAAGRAGASRRRVLEVVRKVNPPEEVLP